MKSAILSRLIDFAMKNITSDLIKRVADSLLNVLESAIVDSETKTDDRVLLPLCKMIREALSLPDEV